MNRNRRPSRRPQPIADVLAELMALRGYARVQAATSYQAAWRDAAGDFVARQSRIAALRRGVLEITVANSTLMQELGFQKVSLLAALAKRLPDESIRELRFRVGAIDP